MTVNTYQGWAREHTLKITTLFVLRRVITQVGNVSECVSLFHYPRSKHASVSYTIQRKRCNRCRLPFSSFLFIYIFHA